MRIGQTGYRCASAAVLLLTLGCAGGPRTKAPDLQGPPPRLAPLRTVTLHRGLETMPAAIALQSGDPMSLSPDEPAWQIHRVHAPTTNALGQPAFSFEARRDAEAAFGVWFNGETLWNSLSDFETPVTGLSGVLGVESEEQWVLHATTEDAGLVLSSAGALLRDGDPAPGLEDARVQLSRRPTMSDSGESFWYSETVRKRRPGVKGPRQARVLYRVSPDSPATVTPVLKSGDPVGDDDRIAARFGLDMRYDISDNGEHHIQLVRLEGARVGREVAAIYLDGRVPHRMGDFAERGTIRSFAAVAVNDSGNYLVSGVVTGPEDGLTFLAHDGRPLVWEGDRLDGERLAGPLSVLGVSLDNTGRAVHSWSTRGFGKQLLYLSCDASQLNEASLLLATGDRIDADGDGEAESLVSSLGGSRGPAFDLANFDELFVRVTLSVGRENRETILALPLPACTAAEAPIDAADTAPE